jgi:hypothetical protein
MEVFRAGTQNRLFQKHKGLLFLVFLLSVWGRAISPQIQPIRTVTIQVLVDEEYKREHDWRETTSRLVGSASMVFEKTFGIRLKINRTDSWTSDNSHLSMPELLNDLQRSKFPPDGDMVLGLTGQPHLNPDLSGVASYLYAYILLRRSSSFSAMRKTLLHEISHLFGAADLLEKGSIMSKENQDVKFDAFTKKIVFLNKQRRFNPFVFPLQEDKRDQAEALYKGRTESFPLELDSHIYLALIGLEKEDYALMIDECLKAAEIHPGLPEVLNLLGIAYRRSGEIERAIETYRKVIDIQPDLPEVHYNLGIAYMKKGMSDRAMEEYKRAIFLKPQYAQAFSNLGFLYLEMGQVDLALEFARKALHIYPELPEALSRSRLWRSIPVCPAPTTIWAVFS